MPQTQEGQEPEYELKHRITGAVILMSAAVLIIPMLLSEPGVEANSADPRTTTEHQTFRSRIVPLDISNVNRPAGEAGELPLSTLGDNRPALLDLTSKSQPDAPAKTENTGESSDKSGETRTALVMTQESKGDDKPAAEKPAPEATTEPAPKPAEKPAQHAAAQPAKPAPASEPTVSSGWVVRVGTYAKKANVESVSTLLSKSGYTPRTTPVPTSLGESTRVWIGPYANRETADEISVRLESLTGEKGYVTRSGS